MILLCYDGSSDARAAIDRAGELMIGQPATVLTVWEPFVDLMARSGASLGLPPLDSAEIDAATERAARTRAEEGVERARSVGLNAQPRTRAHGSTTAETILSEADEVGAVAVVLGTRGLTGLKSLPTPAPTGIPPRSRRGSPRRSSRMARRSTSTSSTRMKSSSRRRPTTPSSSAPRSTPAITGTPWTARRTSSSRCSSDR